MFRKIQEWSGCTILLAVVALFGCGVDDTNRGVDPTGGKGEYKGVENQRAAPFCPGEKLVYDVILPKFFNAKLGVVTLEVHDNEQIDGVIARHFRMTSRSEGWAKNLANIDDTIDSYTNLSVIRSLKYVKTRRGKEIADILVEFNQEEGQAQYINGSKDYDPIVIDRETIDPLAVYYAIRMFSWADDVNMDVNVTDGLRSSVASATLEEHLSTKVFNEVQAAMSVVLNPGKVYGVFPGSARTTPRMWFTASDGRIPFKFETSFENHSVILNLREHEGPCDLATHFDG